MIELTLNTQAEARAATTAFDIGYSACLADSSRGALDVEPRTARTPNPFRGVQVVEKEDEHG